jgi:hypothetical protein
LKAACVVGLALLLPQGGAEGLLEMPAPPYTLRFPPQLSREAGQIAAAVPAVVDRLTRELEAPPLPPSVLYIVEAAGSLPGSDLASAMPEWAAGIAMPEAHTVVIRPERVPSYTQRRLAGVLAHETAHLIAYEAAGRGAGLMPSWFREGVAGTLARDGEWMDFVVLWLSQVPASPAPLEQLDACFSAAGSSVQRKAAYAGSFSFLQFAGRRHGARFPARVLAGLRDGLDFEAAWARAAKAAGGAGGRLDQDERAWSVSLRGRMRWIAVLTSTFTLWTAITLLVVLAYLWKRRRGRRLMERWTEDEPFD